MAVAHRIYADALFRAALEKNRLAQVREDLGDFVAAVESVPELEALLTNPEIDRTARRAALEEILDAADELVEHPRADREGLGAQRRGDPQGRLRARRGLRPPGRLAARRRERPRPPRTTSPRTSKELMS
jgi:hypothetical protein